MRKIRLFIASSLDGYIARASGEVDWLFTDQDYGYSEFFAQVDTLLMGNKTYQQVLGFGEYPYTGKQGFVFSKTRSGERDDNVEFVGGDVKEFINTLRQSSGGDIWLVGGAQIVHFFMKHGFVDELILSIHPIILGSGIALIVNDPSLETALELKNVKPYESGLLQVSYNLKR
ncbi:MULTISPECIES: dihydrofolate reductase family protein [unclassified Coleofasciculus]|uniref:dihydrofolate reductase family protein n=1 Tax=unclassified Coleofasciculus TaxID=2692782 RepID=UPI00187F35EF|nr:MULTISPECIES: dihydrofolate reductase family protein [unclassified Coleofasciculus]MBE9129411.1 dihydrofolate reductase [Coleofasciculus sp. LEGE 07081]MBE9152050.1 dihydrofolate reductase [Coleofasciculus sp. LEGE 07092]